MKPAPLIVSALAVLLLASAAHSDVKVIVERSEAPSPDFKFKSIPAPSKADAAVRAAFGDEFFAAKARHAIAAFAGDHFNGGFVYEFHGVCACSGK